MKPHILALAAASAAASAALAAAIAEDLGAEVPETGATGTEPAATTRRTRGPNKPKEPEAPAGKSYEELQELIAPLVEDNKGDEVKKVIAKHAPGGGGLKELANLPQNQAAFEKDLKALAF